MCCCFSATMGGNTIRLCHHQTNSASSSSLSSSECDNKKKHRLFSQYCSVCVYIYVVVLVQMYTRPLLYSVVLPSSAPSNDDDDETSLLLATSITTVCTCDTHAFYYSLIVNSQNELCREACCMMYVYLYLRFTSYFFLPSPFSIPLLSVHP